MSNQQTVTFSNAKGVMIAAQSNSNPDYHQKVVITDTDNNTSVTFTGSGEDNVMIDAATYQRNQSFWFGDWGSRTIKLTFMYSKDGGQSWNNSTTDTPVPLVLPSNMQGYQVTSDDTGGSHDKNDTVVTLITITS